MSYSLPSISLGVHSFACPHRSHKITVFSPFVSYATECFSVYGFATSSGVRRTQRSDFWSKDGVIVEVLLDRKHVAIDQRVAGPPQTSAVDQVSTTVAQGFPGCPPPVQCGL
jgi:hypothetical protein